ncbi:MAG TPA: hypothetical protein H9671_03800 [Firmicutes bacterium]|nr:hypothetical protein [Bacillota bacterium]
MSIFSSGMVSRLIAQLFEDRASVYRSEEGKNPDGTTASGLQEIPVLQDLPCRISFPYQVNLDQPYNICTQNNPERMRGKLFLPPETDIRKGDFIRVQRREAETLTEYIGYAGVPIHYSTHIEVIFEERRFA